MKFQQKERNKTYLLTKNIKIRKKSKKLNYIKVRTFFINTKKKIVNYKLELLKNAKV